MHDPGCALAGEYADHVEAQRVEVRIFFGEVLFGQRADSGLLLGGDGFEWISETHAPAYLDLGEDERKTSVLVSTYKHFRYPS